MSRGGSSSRISAKLHGIIAHAGPISFAEFMRVALYDPEDGYYSAAPSAVFGGDGDFITAPEMGSVFSRGLAAKCAEALRLLPGADILELGAGSGRMALDVLKSLQQMDCLPRRYLIHDVSPVMRQRQRQLLGDHYGQCRIEWPELPLRQAFDGVVLGNEVVDALPFHSLVLRAGQWRQRCVANAGGIGQGFVWQELPLAGNLRQHAPALPAAAGEYPDGYLSECRSDVGSWLADVSASLRRGLLLFVDYGYPRHEYLHPQRAMGAMLCHRRHAVDDDPLRDVGQKDITASVDFTALADEGLAQGLELHGYTTQAGFMLSMGVDRMLQGADERRQLGSLLHHGAMGTRFQALAFAKGMQDVLAAPGKGFDTWDHRWRLQLHRLENTS